MLFADFEAGVIGAAHAGWRGALAGVTDSTIDAMERLGARRDNIHAAVGPCIGQASYEVDEAFRARFVEDDSGNARFFVTGASGKPHFDLEGYVVHRLIAAGIGEVEALSLDTYADSERFYSYRRATHRGEADYGRQLSAVATSGLTVRRSDLAARRAGVRRLATGDLFGQRERNQRRPAHQRRPRPSTTTIGNHKLKPSTLMMGYGFDPELSEGR